MKHVRIIAVLALTGGCGAPFLEETTAEDCDIYIVDPGEIEAPVDYVEVHIPRGQRGSDSDAGMDGSP